MKSGDKCTVNGIGDLFMECEAREFINAKCVVVKITRAGLVQVALRSNQKHTYSVAKRNINLNT